MVNVVKLQIECEDLEPVEQKGLQLGTRKRVGPQERAEKVETDIHVDHEASATELNAPRDTEERLRLAKVPETPEEDVASERGERLEGESPEALSSTVPGLAAEMARFQGEVENDVYGLFDDPKTGDRGRQDSKPPRSTCM